jgi:hypothetical protein
MQARLSRRAIHKPVDNFVAQLMHQRLLSVPKQSSKAVAKTCFEVARTVCISASLVISRSDAPQNQCLQRKAKQQMIWLTSTLQGLHERKANCQTVSKSYNKSYVPHCNRGCADTLKILLRPTEPQANRPKHFDSLILHKAMAYTQLFSMTLPCPSHTGGPKTPFRRMWTAHFIESTYIP